MSLSGHAPLFDRRDKDRSFVPTKASPAAACSRGPGRPSGRRRGALPWTAANPAAHWRRLGMATLAALLACGPGAPGRAAELPRTVAPLIAEASRRFDLPAGLIGGVMRRESGWRADAVSSAGALGLMQVMPGTYADLRRRYALGADPLQPHDNVLAGAAYLRELYDRFGERGFLAAYNAGPQRYFDWLAFGRTLPLETRIYADQLQRDVRIDAQGTPSPALGVFVATRPGSSLDRGSAVPSRGGLFVPLRPDGQVVSHDR
jgi:hypothetical protein